MVKTIFYGAFTSALRLFYVQLNLSLNGPTDGKYYLLRRFYYCVKTVLRHLRARFSEVRANGTFWIWVIWVPPEHLALNKRGKIGVK